MARMTFDQLYRISEPKRMIRAGDVSGPPLDIDAYKDAVYYAFNFKSHATNTTGLRHHGYVKFFKPRSNQPQPLQNLQCIADCTCPDYRYRWAWSNKQRGSGVVGPKSMNQAWNRAPRKTNPRSVPGLCKHLGHMTAYIYGVMSSFPGDAKDAGAKLDKMLSYARKRWDDFPGAMDAAKERDQKAKDRAHQRNVSGPTAEPQPPAGPPQPPELPTEVELPEPPESDINRVAVPPSDRRRPFPGGLPAPPDDELSALRRVAVPPSERRRSFPGRTPVTPEKEKGKIETSGFPTVAQRRAARYGENLKYECVVNAIDETIMKTLETTVQPLDLKIVKIVEEMQDDFEQSMGAPDSIGLAEPDAVAAPDLPPSEPPIDDTALGADTEGETALGLLKQMRDSLQQLTIALAPPPEEEMGVEGEGGAGGPPMPPTEGSPEGGDEFGVPEPEASAEGEEGGEGPEEEETEEAEEDKPPRKSRPVE